jgi:hypothetical protein
VLGNLSKEGLQGISAGQMKDHPSHGGFDEGTDLQEFCSQGGCLSVFQARALEADPAEGFHEDISRPGHKEPELVVKGYSGREKQVVYSGPAAIESYSQ